MTRKLYDKHRYMSMRLDIIYVAYFTESDLETSDRLALQIEITEEMLEAGEDGLWSTPGAIQTAGLFSVSDLVSAVYRAMRAVDPATLLPSRGRT
jgi:hypothetical protein